ncbi:hypothetical protein M770_06400 [Pseudomonas aeruginosa VRFPA03]|nr:hypothetical protein M770_06400 [Pseudomonas aeruginosa VRFPA03]
MLLLSIATFTPDGAGDVHLRAVAAAPALCWAPLAANQAALNGWEAWAPPATMSKAMICASGFSRGKPPSSETVTGDDGTNGRDGMTRDSLGVFNSTRRLANAHS